MKTLDKFTKRQHTIPRVYLKHFGESQKKEGYIYALDITKEKSSPFRTNIRNVCVETEYYTLDSLSYEKKLILENFFSKNIEKNYDEVYDILTDPKIIDISEDTRFKIIVVCISQLFRTPKLKNQFNAFWNRIIDFSYDITGTNTKTSIVDFGHVTVDTSTKDKDEFIKEESKRNKELVVVESINRMADFTLRRMNDGISVKTMHPNHKLITSDNPVFSSDHIYHSESFIRMPINENILLMLIPNIETNITRISRQTFDENWSFLETFANNCNQLKTAERFVLGTKRGLDDFLKFMDEFNKEDVQQKFNDLKLRIDRINDYSENPNENP